MADLSSKKSINDMINNDKMSHDEVVASYVPRGTCYPQKRPYPSFKNNTGHTDGPKDLRTDGRTRPLVEMRSRI